MDTITVKNESGQVVSLSYDGEGDPRKQIIDRRIQMGELEKVSKSTKSKEFVGRSRRVVEDYHTGLRDERGDLLKSVHGGGGDPDADGDEMGQPSGSKPVEGAIEIDGKEPVGDSHPAAVEDAPQAETKPAARRSSSKK